MCVGNYSPYSDMWLDYSHIDDIISVLKFLFFIFILISETKQSANHVQKVCNILVKFLLIYLILFFLQKTHRFEDTNVSGVTQLKSSVQKGIKNRLVEQFPYLENYIDEIIPKKENLRIVKW